MNGEQLVQKYVLFLVIDEDFAPHLKENPSTNELGLFGIAFRKNEENHLVFRVWTTLEGEIAISEESENFMRINGIIHPRLRDEIKEMFKDIPQIQSITTRQNVLLEEVLNEIIGR